MPTPRDQYLRCFAAQLALEAALKSLHLARNLASQGDGPDVDHEMRDRLQAHIDGLDSELTRVVVLKLQHEARL